MTFACRVLVVLGVLLVGCAAPGSLSAPEAGLKPGQRAPEFQVTSLDGAPVTSAQLLGEGKPFVLYFFATW